MPRVIWKGAVSFGLVHIPVALVPATTRQGVDFDWLDKRSMDPVGYKRINKVTGKDIEKENIVKGVELEKGNYVVISEEEIRAAHPKVTQTVDIVAFVDAEKIPFLFIDTPYYLTPDRRGEKVYALLREALVATGKVGLANVVLHTKQHLAVVMPLGEALVLNTLRWADEVRGIEALELKDEAIKPDLAKRELDMATRLIEEMSEDWQPEQYKDTFQEQIMALVEQKAKEGKVEAVSEPDDDGGERRSADVIDLTELLKRSLGAKPAASKPAAKAAPKKTEKIEKAEKPARKPAAKTATKPAAGRTTKKKAS
ncbi:Ku protein [Pseudomonas kuykendallii]|uniref:Non-homologous end joining protein Ku n=1 Tax=Pseudomonas kuykendallii TaxID=1007099 RepID=A0A1H3DFS2_9PSED|nr:Ku protein [Pseudomonas kuykendallii]MCQ4270300.1 Ku protein [Pseudomonas kuykendallii]SDX65170.1 DNA end-binding protein Ku [Pseudomonas kuykendallii]